MPGDTNSVTRLAMMRAIVKAGPIASFPCEYLAELIERESGYRELYEMLQRVYLLMRERPDAGEILGAGLAGEIQAVLAIVERGKQ